MKFQPGQAVTVTFNRGCDNEFSYSATVVENIDAGCAPLTNMWLVRLPNGCRFGISGEALA